LRGVEVVVAIRQSDSALKEMNNIVVRVLKSLVDPQAEDVFGACSEPIDLRAQSGAQIGGELGFVRNGRNAGELVCEWRQTFGFDGSFVEEAGVVVAYLLRCAAWRRVGSGGILNEIADLLGRPFGQDCARVVSRSASRYRRSLQPTAVGIAIEVVAGLNGAIESIFCNVLIKCR